MNIEYKDTQNFTAEELESLFLSVNWSSGKYPEKLQVAMANSAKVYSAWDGEKLVGLMNALSDGAMTAYFHYLLVRPEYQDQGIGRELVRLMLAEYEDYARKVLIAYENQVHFYERCGFKAGEGTRPMAVTYLTT